MIQCNAPRPRFPGFAGVTEFLIEPWAALPEQFTEFV
jgi:hypothetical protein